MKKRILAIMLALVMSVSGISFTTNVKAATYTAEKIVVKARIGKRVVLKPVVYKDGVKLDLSQKGYQVLWAYNSKNSGGLANGGKTKTVKKVKAEDFYNGGNKKEYIYIILYNNDEVVRSSARIMCKGKVKVEKIALKSVKYTEEGKIDVKMKQARTITGMEIAYATNNKFTENKKVKKIFTTTYWQLDKIKQGKDYYVKVRGFAVIKKKKKYGKWSRVLKVTVPAKETETETETEAE